MCEQDTKQPLAPYCAAPAGDDGMTRSSARRRLWELPPNTHCPVIGVCLPLGVLRRLVNKGVRGKALADDYEIHVGAVTECGSRNRVSVLLQDAVRAGDVAGAFWATLTHPRSDFLLPRLTPRSWRRRGGSTTRPCCASAGAAAISPVIAA